jgi:hypothetical protein
VRSSVCEEICSSFGRAKIFAKIEWKDTSSEDTNHTLSKKEKMKIGIPTAVYRARDLYER